MRSFWSDPYLWVHLAGIATVPIFLELCLLGFAVGDPLLPVWLELLFVGAVGIAPVLWMQWQRPFYIFSLLAVSLKPEQLTEDQRRLLTLFKAQRNRIAAAIVPIFLFILLQKTYTLSAIAVPVTPFPADWRIVGLLVAAIGFLACNLFAQVPVSVLGVMLHTDAAFSATRPYPAAQIRNAFALYGLRVNRILPPVVAASTVPAIAAPTTEPTAPASPSETETPQSAATETPPPAETVAAVVVPVGDTPQTPTMHNIASQPDNPHPDSPEASPEPLEDDLWEG